MRNIYDIISHNKKASCYTYLFRFNQKGGGGGRGACQFREGEGLNFVKLCIYLNEIYIWVQHKLPPKNHGFCMYMLLSMANHALMQKKCQEMLLFNFKKITYKQIYLSLALLYFQC